jgi:ABC-type transport system involved in multi-copper enzyme maturation permease subunit
MKSIWIVAQNTLKEIIRDRILYGLIIFAGFLVVAGLLLGELSYAEQERVMTDLGLVGVEFGCCMLAIFVGSSLVWRELEKQTVLLLISKPVKRSHFLIGKFLGLGMVLVLVDVMISIFLAVMCKIYGQVHWPQFILCQGGILLESLFLLSVTLFFGVFSRPVLTSIFALSIWFLGHGINDLHFFSEKSKNPILKTMGLAVAQVFPNLEYFNFKEAVIYGDPITGFSIQRAVAIWAAWFVILLISSIWIFDRRDFI